MTVPTIYAHEGRPTRVIGFSVRRLVEIKNEMAQLELERQMHEDILAMFRPTVCATCAGTKHVMKLIEGCEEEGLRQHPCPTCAGEG